MESLCPACKRLITTRLDSIMNAPDLRPIIDLSIIPFGNGRIISEEPVNIRCQHGENECRGNVALLCGFDKYPELTFEYAKCMESLTTPEITENDILTCGSQVGFDEVQSVLDCFNGEEGEQLHLIAAQKTPSHRYVPWVLVDGKLVGNLRTLKDSICSAYQGPLPSSCENTMGGRRLREEKEEEHVSFAFNNSTKGMTPQEFQDYIRSRIEKQFHVHLEDKKKASLEKNRDAIIKIKNIMAKVPIFKSFISNLVEMFFNDVE